MECLGSKKINNPSFNHFASGLETRSHADLDNVQSAFNIGNEEEINDALLQLIQLCQSKELPHSDIEKAHHLLFAFLKKISPAEIISSDQDGMEIERMLANALEKALVLECEKFADYRQRHRGGSFTPSAIDDSQKLHQLINIFLYLNDKVAHLDDQLFDEACYLHFKNKSLASSVIFHILLNSKIKDDASIMLDHSSKNINYKLCLPRLNEFRPKCAVLDVACRNQHQPMKYVLASIELALENVNQFALEMVFKSEDPEVLDVLCEVLGNGDFASKTKLNATPDERQAARELRQLHMDGCFNDLKMRDLEAIFKEKSPKYQVAQSVRFDQLRKFNIADDESIERRLDLAKNCLAGPAAEGAEILMSLTRLDHPKAKEAKEILNAWLDKTENRLLLMKEYRALTLSLSNSYDKHEPVDVVRYSFFQKKYERKFRDQLAILLEQVRTFNEQGRSTEARCLVYQLLEQELQLEVIKQHKMDVTFYRMLIASNTLDDIAQNEVLRRWEILLGKKPVSSLRDYVDFNAPKRPWANYQLGLILKDDDTSVLLNIKEAKDHFQRAFDDGLPVAEEALKKLKQEMSFLDEHAILDEGEMYIRKHRARYFFDKDQSDLKHALSCYKWVADEFSQSEALRAYSRYLKYLPEMHNVDDDELLHAGEKVLDHFPDLSEHEVQNYLAVLDKAAKSRDVKVAAEAHLVLAKVYEKAISTPIESSVAIRSNLAAQGIENAALHYYRAVKLGNKKAREDEVFFLATQILANAGHPLKQNLTFILRLKAIVDNKSKGTGKETIRQACLALAAYYSELAQGSLSALVGVLNPLQQSKKYEDIARRLNLEIEIEQIEQTVSSNSSSKASQLELEGKRSRQLHLASLKHDLAEIHLNAVNEDRGILKATELFIEAADLEHQATASWDWEHQASMQYQASKEALVKLANKLMKQNSYSTPELESLYKLSQVADTVLGENEIIFISSEVLLEQAAKMGHPEANTKLALKADWDSRLIEEDIRQAKLVEEKIREASWEQHREQHPEQYKNVGRSSKRNPDFYDK